MAKQNTLNIKKRDCLIGYKIECMNLQCAKLKIHNIGIQLYAGNFRLRFL